jgi:hypothetical protein
MEIKNQVIQRRTPEDAMAQAKDTLSYDDYIQGQGSSNQDSGRMANTVYCMNDGSMILIKLEKLMNFAE